MCDKLKEMFQGYERIGYTPVFILMGSFVHGKPALASGIADVCSSRSVPEML